jgi:hypothetical protein
MIEIIMYWMLSNSNVPTFIWVMFWLHIVFKALLTISNLSKPTTNHDLNDIGKDEEF